MLSLEMKEMNSILSSEEYFNKGPNYMYSKCYRTTCMKFKTERHILSTTISDENVTDRAASFASIMAELPPPEPFIIISPLLISGMSVEGGLDVVFNFVVAFFVDVGSDGVVGCRRLVVGVGLCVVLTVGGFLVVCGCVRSGAFVEDLGLSTTDIFNFMYRPLISSRHAPAYRLSIPFCVPVDIVAK